MRVKFESITIELSIFTINDCVASKNENNIWRYLWNHLYKEEEEEDYKQSDTKKQCKLSPFNIKAPTWSYLFELFNLEIWVIKSRKPQIHHLATSNINMWQLQLVRNFHRNVHCFTKTINWEILNFHVEKGILCLWHMEWWLVGCLRR